MRRRGLSAGSLACTTMAHSFLAVYVTYAMPGLITCYALKTNEVYYNPQTLSP